MNRKILLLAALLIMILSISRAQDVGSKIDDIKSVLINGDYETGLKECEALLKTGISDTMQLATVYGYAGLSSEVLKHKTEAINYYKKAVELQMPQLDVYDKLINLSKKEKNDSVYEFALLEKSKAFPEFEQDVTKSLAYHYVSVQQYEKLLNTTNQLLNWQPDDYNFLYFKAVALQNLNQIEEARVFYAQVLKIKPDHPGANMSLGLNYYNEGSEIFLNRKKEYEALAKPNWDDYSVYEKGIEKGKALYRQALPGLITAYESGSYPDLKPLIFNIYIRLEQKDKAELYR